MYGDLGMKYFDHKIIAVDFDGTLCENSWPDIGSPNFQLIEYLKHRQSHHGDKIILWTCRTGLFLSTAVQWCAMFGLTFDAINENVPEAVCEFGGDSRKIFADEYIDDKNGKMFDLPYYRREI